MVFIQFQDKRTYEASFSILFDNAKSCFQSIRNEGAAGGVYAIVPETQLLLDEAGHRYTVIQEEDLKQVLSPGGYVLYEHVRDTRPHYLYRESLLPPLGYIRAQMYVDPNNATKAREALVDLGATIFSERDVHFAHLAEGPDFSRRVTFEFFVPKMQQDNLLSRLAEETVAGYDRIHQIRFYRDPDSLK